MKTKLLVATKSATQVENFLPFTHPPFAGIVEISKFEAYEDEASIGGKHYSFAERKDLFA